MRSLRPVLLAAGTVLLLAAAGTAGGQDRPPVTIADSLGRTVTVPGRVARVLSLEPEVTRIIAALGAGDRLVGIDHFLRFNDHLFPLVFPGAASLPLVSNPAQDLSVEEAVRLRPDVIFASPSESRLTRSVERKLRVPVVALASMGRFSGLLEEIRTLGRVLGREARAGELVSRFEGTLRGLAVPAAETAAGRPTVYLAFWNSLVRTPVAYDPVDAAGGRNVAAGTAADYAGSPGVTIPLEKLLLWDPEIILVQGNYPPSDRRVTVEGLLGDPRLASLRAVRNRRVHYTFGYWYWWDPALALVETVYLARLFRPGADPGFDLAAFGDGIFKEFYGVAGAFSALCRRLDCHAWIRE